MAYIGKGSGFNQKTSMMSAMREDIRSYKNLNTTAPHDENYKLAIRTTHFAFKLPEHVKLCHLSDVFKKDLPIWSSSPGLPWINMGYRTKGDIQANPEAVQSVRWLWQRVKRGENIKLPVCCAYVSSQSAELGAEKINVEWRYPASVTFAEAMYVIPLIEAYKTNGLKIYPIDYDLKNGLKGCRKLYSSFKGNYFLGIVFKSFNKTLPPWLIEFAFDILLYNIDLTAYENYGIPITAQMFDVFKILKNYAINTRIQLRNGERYKKNYGLANGSYFSDLVESVCNYVLITYACLKLGIKIISIKVFRHNSIIGIDKSVTLNDISSVLEPLGITLNVTKSCCVTNIRRLK